MSTSTSFTNPAVTIGRTLSDTFAGIRWTSAPAFIAAQLAGGMAAIALGRYLFPDLPAVDVVVPTTTPRPPDTGSTPGKRYEDWPLDDPAGQDVEAVRPIRDEIERRVRALLESLGVPSH